VAKLIHADVSDNIIRSGCDAITAKPPMSVTGFW
jgi:hypothetical protein